MELKTPPLYKHIRDILILPVTVTILVPIWIYDSRQHLLPDNLVFRMAGIIFFSLGLSLFMATVYLFYKIGKGTLAPWSPTHKLVVRGPYRYSRNPMISGVFFILIGEFLFFHSTNILLWAVVFFAINTLYFIIYEEPSLLERFKEEYVQYKKAVPRWIPRFKQYQDT